MFRKNLFVFAIGTIFTKILVYFLIPILTFFLTTSEFGTIDLISTTIELVIPISTLAIVDGVYRFAANKKSDSNQVLLVGLIMWLIGILLCLPVMFFLKFNYANLNYIIYGYFVLYSLFNILSYYLKGLGKSKLYTIITIAYGLLSFGFVILFVCGIKLSIQGYYIGYITALFVSLIILFAVIRPIKILFHSKFNKQLFVEIIKYSAPLVINNISWWILTASDKYVTLWIYGADTNGILAIVHKIPAVLTVAFSIFTSAFQLSAFSEFDFTDKEKEDMSNKYSRIYSLLIVVLILCVSAICIIIEPFTKYLLEPSYYSSFLFVPLYSYAILLYGLNSFFGTIFCVSKKTIPNLISSTIGAGINIGLCILFMKVFNMGLYGAGLSTVISYFVILIYRRIITKNMLTIKTSLKNYLCLTILVGQIIFSSLCTNEILLVSINSGILVLLCVILFKEIKEIFLFVFKREKSSLN